MQDIYYPETDQISLIMKETSNGITIVLKKYPPYTFLKISDVTKKSQYSTKIKTILLLHFQEEHIFGIQKYHAVQKIATISYK